MINSAEKHCTYSSYILNYLLLNLHLFNIIIIYFLKIFKCKWPKKTANVQTPQLLTAKTIYTAGQRSIISFFRPFIKKVCLYAKVFIYMRTSKVGMIVLNHKMQRVHSILRYTLCISVPNAQFTLGAPQKNNATVPGPV